MSNKVIQKQDECIGCGACVAMCPDHWEMNKEGKAVLKGAKLNNDVYEKEVDDIGCNMEAAEGCPVNCIHIEVDGEKKI